MRYLATGAAILGLVLLIFVADLYDQTSKKDNVSSFDDYVVDLKQRMAWLTDMTGGSADDSAINGAGSAQADLPRAFLPDAPDGWTRRAWRSDDRSVLAGLPGADDGFLVNSDFEGADANGQHDDELEKTLVKQRGTTTWLYENQSKLVEMTAIRPMAVGGMADQPGGGDVAGANISRTKIDRPFAVVQGIVWTEIAHSTHQTQGLDVDWHLTARLGDLHLYLRALHAEESDVRLFLDAVDYDGLNGLLPGPPDAVVRDAPKLPAPREMAPANTVMALKRTDQRDALDVTSVNGLAETQAPVAVKVNRFGARKRSANKGGCGGTSFCKASGD